MTILPNKLKKNSLKGERHCTQVQTVRSSAPLQNLNSSTAPDSRKHSSVNATSAVTQKLSSGIHLARKSTPKVNFNNGMFGSECNKQQQNSKRDGSVEHNSDDEYGPGFRDDKMENHFEERLQRMRGYKIKQMKGDGACLFRAVADQIYGDEEMHTDVRKLCMDYMEKNRDHFSQFVTEDFDKYIARKSRDDAHGNHVELQAISEIFSRPIEIYEYSTEPKNIFTPCDRTSQSEPNPPIRLSYHGAVHYNSVIDPLTATIGVGLGLPAYCPGSADRNIMHEATVKSEAQQLEEAMLNDKMKLTDFEQTENEMNEQVARESYLEYIRCTEQCGAKLDRPISGTKRRNVAGAESEPGCSQSPLAKIRSRESSADLADVVIPGVSEWECAAENDEDESALLAHVMALSQQEYLNAQKKKSQCRVDADEAGSSKAR